MYTYGIYVLLDTAQALNELQALYTCVHSERRTTLPEICLGTVKLDEELSTNEQTAFALQFTRTLSHPFDAVLLRQIFN